MWKMEYDAKVEQVEASRQEAIARRSTDGYEARTDLEHLNPITGEVETHPLGWQWVIHCDDCRQEVVVQRWSSAKVRCVRPGGVEQLAADTRFIQRAGRKTTSPITSLKVRKDRRAWASCTAGAFAVVSDAELIQGIAERFGLVDPEGNADERAVADFMRMGTLHTCMGCRVITLGAYPVTPEKRYYRRVKRLRVVYED